MKEKLSKLESVTIRRPELTLAGIWGFMFIVSLILMFSIIGHSDPKDSTSFFFAYLGCMIVASIIMHNISHELWAISASITRQESLLSTYATSTNNHIRNCFDDPFTELNPTSYLNKVSEDSFEIKKASLLLATAFFFPFVFLILPVIVIICAFSRDKVSFESGPEFFMAYNRFN